MSQSQGKAVWITAFNKLASPKGRKQWTSSHRPSESSDPLSWPGMSSSLIEGRGLIATGGQRKGQDKGQEFIRGLEPKGYDWKGGRKRMKPTRKPAPASWGRTAIAVWLRAFSSTYHGMDEGSGIAGSYNFIKSGDGVRLREIGQSISEAPSPFGFGSAFAVMLLCLSFSSVYSTWLYDNLDS